jgi:hypothetical protein
MAAKTIIRWETAIIIAVMLAAVALLLTPSSLASSKYFPAANNVKRVAGAMVFTDDPMSPDLNFGFFEGGFVDSGGKMFFVGKDAMKIVQPLNAEYIEKQKRRDFLEAEGKKE